MWFFLESLWEFLKPVGGFFLVCMTIKFFMAGLEYLSSLVV